ncbi:MAG: caspase family protein [Polyangiaceae bacterium]|nr:caspase family protein [Polyangiaceae bacterium]
MLSSPPRLTPRRFSLFAASAALSVSLALSAPARADEPALTTAPRPFAYGVIVGTNAGGAGQQPLRYAEDDARRVAQVLRELGRYGQADLRVLLSPDSAKVFAAIDDVATKLKAHQAKGEQALLVFYYSGHARANSFSLGGEELAVAQLRDRLREIPSTLTLVVLDACQSGQFARTKGAQPAADFSYNSVSRLTTKGVAIMASSSAQELSQESDELKSSYFTHHLIAGLRGAADADTDGRVSLDEVYRYAYRRTLASTSETQVGSQHVTLETDLAGQGDVPVTYPAAARSQLELPGPLDARVLVQQRANGSVAAEVQKAPGAPLRLAFVAGSYDVLVREGSGAHRALRCKVTLADDRVTPLDLGPCEAVSRPGAAKGETEPGQRPQDPWTLEAGIGVIGRVGDAYTRRLNEFGYRREANLFFDTPWPRAHLGVYHGLTANLSVGGQVHTLAGASYERDAGDSQDSFSFATYGASAFARATTDPLFGASPRATHFEAYGQLGGGLTLGLSRLTTGSSAGGGRATTRETSWGYVVGAAAGLSLVMPRSLSFFAQGGYEYAPTISNLVGETHNSGGASAQVGARLRFE